VLLKTEQYVAKECVLLRKGVGGRGSLCIVHTIKSIDTGEQIFETLLQVKINYSENTLI
jgi:hypothetical protein